MVMEFKSENEIQDFDAEVYAQELSLEFLRDSRRYAKSLSQEVE